MIAARLAWNLIDGRGTIAELGRITIVANLGLIVMAGIGRFRLSDALPKTNADPSRGKKKAKPGEAEPAAEQLREAREASLAKNAEAGSRGHRAETGRAGQQAGRQRAGGGRGK